MTGHSEEDEFAAALDSEAESEEEQEAGGMLLGNVVADRHGFQEPQAPPAMLHSAPGGLVQPPTFVFAGKGKQALDGRPLLLFDINGVLMQHRWNGTSHQHDLRPGVHHLLRLLPHFRLGVYSSATRPTIAKALSKLHHNLANFVEQRRCAAAEQAAADLAAQQAQQAGAAPALPTGKKKRRAALAAAAAGGAGGGDFDADGFPRRLPHILFEVVMARDHCQPASQESIEARGGRPWDTVKPLGRYFASLARVLLVDDSAHKADDGEASNMLVTPCWHGAAHPLGRGDGALPLLVELLLERAAAGAAQDLRRCSAEISAALADAAARQLEAAQAAQQLSAEEAAAAAAVLQAAVAGSAAVAAAAAALEAQGEAEAATSPAAAAEPLAQMDQQQQRQQGAKRAREEDISAPPSAAGPEAGATAEAAEAADTTLPRMTKKQRRELKERQLAAQAAAARDVVLAAAAALGGSGGGAPGSEGGGSVLGATLAEINSYLNTSWEHLSLLLFNRTAKAGLTAACAAGLLQIKGGRAGKAGGRYARTAAGEAAAASEQYIAELDAYCRQLPDRAALLARLEACSQQQEPAEAAAEAGAAAAGVAAASGAPPAAAAGAAAAGEDALLEAGFFWEKPSSSAAQNASVSNPQEAAAPAPAPSAATADAPPPPPPLPAGASADLSALQQAVLLHAVGLLQVRPGVSLEQAVDWVEAALRGAHPELPLHADGDADAAARKQRTRLQRLLRSHLLRAMEACQKEGVATVSRLGRGAPNAMVLFVPTPGAAQPPEAQVEAALQVVAGMLGGGAAQPQPAASPAKPARESAGAAEPAAPQPASWPAAVPEANAVAASGGGMVATTAAAVEEDAAVPMLLEVFEDRAPPPAAAPAAVQAAAGSAPAGGGEEEEAEAARKLQELDDAAAALQARLAEVRRRAGEDGLSGKALSQRVLCAEVAALTGRSDAELAAMGAKALRKLARQARGAAKRARDAAAGKRSAGAAAAALLDRLFPAAAGGDEAAWAAACAALSEAEREVLRGQGIDLEAYRREVATRGAAAGPAASLGDWLCAGGEGEGEEEGGSAGEVDGPPEGDAEGLEAAAGARAAATLDAAVAAHGGHYLRSCDAAAAGAAGDEQPPWFWEQQQQQEQGAGAPLPAHQQQQPQHAAWQPQEQQEQEQAAWQQQQYWQQLRQQQEQALWQAQAAAQRGAGPLSPLHHEVAALALQATPTPLEVAAVQGAVLAVQEAACSLWPEARTALFGSQATGLALPGSDLDIVVLGVGPTLANAATGFTPVQRKQLSELLEDLLDALLQRRLLAGRAQIIEARVPIIKCRLAVGDGLAADISMGAENGAQAVDFVRRQVLAVPPLRPLCLVIKAFLRERCANEVFTGGLSSYSVFNMVMAHLQLEGYQPGLANPSHEAAAQQQQRGRGGRAGRAPPPPLPADLQETLGFLHQLAAGALPAMSQAGGAQQQGEGKAPSADLGTLLWGFFDRFGNHFSYAKQAVSIRMGGVCLKLRQWKNPRRPWALAVEDPQEMGKDIGGGSTAIREIKESFAQAAEMLAEVCEDLDANDAAAAAPPPGAAGGGGGAPPQQRPGQGPLLGGVLNLEAAVGRGPEAIKARAAMEATAAAKSQALLHERIKAGVAVGRGFGGGAAPRPLKGKAASRATRAAAKAERRQRLAEANEAYLTGRRRGGGGEARQQQQQSPAAGRKPGSKRGRAVEAAWGNTRGQYKDVSDDDGGWSLRKQKKGKAKKGAAAKGSAGKGAAGKGAAASAKKQKRAKAQGEGGGAKKRARKD